MKFARLIAFASLAACSQPALGAIYSDPSKLPKHKSYDYIVVGCQSFYYLYLLAILTDTYPQPVLVEVLLPIVFRKTRP